MSSQLRLIFLIPYSIKQRRQWHPTPVLLSGTSHGRRSLVGCSSWGREESDMTEWLHFHFSLLCTGERNGNPLQCSRLENPRDGVAQSRTRLKWLSSSSSNSIKGWIMRGTLGSPLVYFNKIWELQKKKKKLTTAYFFLYLLHPTYSYLTDSKGIWGCKSCFSELGRLTPVKEWN